jgi:putative DNA primase/helicase
MHFVLCPWADEHTSKKPGTATIIIEADSSSTQWPSFSCFHSHCARRGIKDVIEAWPDAVRFCSKPWVANQDDVAVARGEKVGKKGRAAKKAATKTPAPAPPPGQPVKGGGGTALPALGPNDSLPSNGNADPYTPNSTAECKDGFPTTIVELVRRYAYVSGLNKVLDQKDGDFLAAADLRNTISGRLFETQAEGWKQIDFFKLSGRRQCKRGDIVFDPSAKVAFPRINLFTGYEHDRDAPLSPKDLDTKTELTLALLHYLCGDDTGYVLKWLAYPFQFPGAKMRSSLIIHGAQGIGKNLIFERAMVDAYGRWGRLIDQRDLDSAFNGWMSKKLYIVADEVATDKRKTDTSNLLKSWITGGTVSVNEKNLPVREEANHCNFVFLSNHAVPIFVDEDDRRYCVIRVPEAPLAGDYYQLAANEIASTRGGAWYQYLKSYSVNESFIHDPVPTNEAKAELRLFCRSSIDLFLDEWACIDAEGHGAHDLAAAIRGDNDMRLPYQIAYVRDVYRAYRVWCKWNGVEHRASKKSFSIKGLGRREFVKGRTSSGRYIIPPKVPPTALWLDRNEQLEKFQVSVDRYCDRRE